MSISEQLSPTCAGLTLFCIPHFSLFLVKRRNEWKHIICLLWICKRLHTILLKGLDWKKMSQILLGSVVYATWDVLLEVGFVLLLLMYSTRFMMYDAVDIYTYFWPFVLLKSFVQMCKSISYAQSTFNDKTNHRKINDNYIFF